MNNEERYREALNDIILLSPLKIDDAYIIAGNALAQRFNPQPQEMETVEVKIWYNVNTCKSTTESMKGCVDWIEMKGFDQRPAKPKKPVCINCGGTEWIL